MATAANPSHAATASGVRNPADIRNIALVGHGGAGKTSLTERLLHDSGAIGRLGAVEEGNTVSDFSDEEKHHQHSMRPTVVHIDHEGHRVNIIDTPGRSDFIGGAIASLPAAETAVVVIDAIKGVQSNTRRLMQIAKQRELPRMIVVNKIDAPEIDLESLTDSIRGAFGNVCLPINLPNADMSGTIDVFEHEGDEATAFSSVGDAHQQIIEQVVEVDEDLMNTYLETGGEGLDPKAIHNAFEQALREGHLIPIVYTSATTGAGAKQLLHIMSSLLPSPLEGNPRTFLAQDDDGNPTPVQPEADASKPLIAHVFQVVTDKFVGKTGVFRVHQGTIQGKSEVHIDDEKKPIRISHLAQRQGESQSEAHALGPGDIGAITKVDEIHFDATLHDGSHGALGLRPLPMPKPMFGLAIELKNHADEGKFGDAIQKLIDEDPSLVLDRIAATKQTVLRGLGELHLRAVLEKLKDRSGIELITSPPKVAYKEAISGRAEGHHRHKKQTGGAGQFGEVYLRVEPLPNDHETGFEFVNGTVGGSIPRQFMPAIEKGVRSVLKDGAIAGYPLTGVRVEVYDGKHHPVDSKEVAFVTAGRRAFIDAIGKASPILLEPFVTVEITAPSQYLGDLTGEISGKRGRVQDTEMVGSDTIILKAQAPAGELQNLSTELKSITQGAASYTMDYSHDEPCPPHVQQEVVAAYNPHSDDD